MQPSTPTMPSRARVRLAHGRTRPLRLAQLTRRPWASPEAGSDPCASRPAIDAPGERQKAAPAPLARQVAPCPTPAALGTCGALPSGRRGQPPETSRPALPALRQPRGNCFARHLFPEPLCSRSLSAAAARRRPRGRADHDGRRPIKPARLAASANGRPSIPAPRRPPSAVRLPRHVRGRQLRSGACRHGPQAAPLRRRGMRKPSWFTPSCRR